MHVSHAPITDMPITQGSNSDMTGSSQDAVIGRRRWKITVFKNTSSKLRSCDSWHRSWSKMLSNCVVQRVLEWNKSLKRGHKNGKQSRPAPVPTATTTTATSSSFTEWRALVNACSVYLKSHTEYDQTSDVFLLQLWDTLTGCRDALVLCWNQWVGAKLPKCCNVSFKNDVESCQRAWTAWPRSHPGVAIGEENTLQPCKELPLRARFLHVLWSPFGLYIRLSSEWRSPIAWTKVHCVWTWTGPITSNVIIPFDFQWIVYIYTQNVD